MYCNCAYRHNPIGPAHFFKVALRAIWPDVDEVSAKEAIAAKNVALKFLLAVKTEGEVDQLKQLLNEVWDASINKAGALGKLTVIYNEAAAGNKALPRTLLAATGKKEPRKSSISSRRTKAQPPPPKPTTSQPRKGPPPKSTTSRFEEDPTSGRSPPRPSEACRACDGSGRRKKTDKENVLRKEEVVYCSKCGGTGKEPTGPPKKGRGRGRFAPHQEEEEDEKDANKAADAFLRKHGYGKWGQQ